MCFKLHVIKISVYSSVLKFLSFFLFSFTGFCRYFEIVVFNFGAVVESMGGRFSDKFVGESALKSLNPLSDDKQSDSLCSEEFFSSQSHRMVY